MTVTLKAVALDPGVTTGFATGLIDDGEMLVVTGQARLDHLTFWLQLSKSNPEVLISERFEFRQKARKGLELYSRELIGITNLFCQMYERKLCMQQPGDAMHKFPDTQLKKDGIYKPANVHANDAARHLLWWFQHGSGYQYNTKGYRSGVI